MRAPHILIVEARFYEDLADELAAGAIAALEAHGATVERVAVPGALEVPVAIAAALETGLYDGFVALGCVIRGETTHYDTVTEESARGLMELGVNRGASIGNGILTVENAEQAWARALVTDKNKGAGAAEACLALVEIRRRFAAASGPVAGS